MAAISLAEVANSSRPPACNRGEPMLVTCRSHCALEGWTGAVLGCRNHASFQHWHRDSDAPIHEENAGSCQGFSYDAKDITMDSFLFSTSSTVASLVLQLCEERMSLQTGVFGSACCALHYTPSRDGNYCVVGEFVSQPRP